MSKRKTDVIENFGERLAQLRKAAGYTQVEFAAEVAVSSLKCNGGELLATELREDFIRGFVS
jgi:transcriptional regulator with XRE-family HTH domain